MLTKGHRDGRHRRLPTPCNHNGISSGLAGQLREKNKVNTTHKYTHILNDGLRCCLCLYRFCKCVNYTFKLVLSSLRFVPGWVETHGCLFILGNEAIGMSFAADR